MATKTKFLKFYTVFIDGIDKTGKDTIRQYVWRLDKSLNVFVRGWPSLYVYAKKFNRDVIYELPYRDALYVMLTVDEIDWQIRCEMTNEPKINYKNDQDLFDKSFKILIEEGFNVCTFNTTELTPYKIAKLIVDKIHSLNKGVDSND